MAGRDRGVVEETEAHRRRCFGVMARRAHGAEGPVEIARGHAPDRRRHRSAGPFGGGQTAGRHGGVWIQPHPPALGRRGMDGVDIGPGMHAQEVGLRRLGRLAQVLIQASVGQGRDHRLEPARPLGMAVAGIVGQHVQMGEDRDGHDANIAACAAIAPRS